MPSHALDAPPPVTNCHTFSDPLPPRALRTLWMAPNPPHLLAKMIYCIAFKSLGTLWYLIVVASDLYPKHECNVIVKFADDRYLLVGSNHFSTATEEFEHISAWTMKNNLGLNPNKTREPIVVRKGQKSIISPPLIIPGASRVSSIRVLGVTVSSDLVMGQHLDEVLATCASSMYALRGLRSHGLPHSAIHKIARMTTVSSLM